MAFRKKVHLILSHQPDILVIPECEHPDKMIFPVDTTAPTQTLWFGKNKNKGLALFSFGNYTCKVIKAHNEDFKMIVPIKVSGGSVDFNLFAIWAYNPNDKDGKYITQIWKAIHYYDKLIKRKQAILIGDFNSNTIWDQKRRISNHSNVVQLLEEKGIFSTYHLHHNQIQGKEKHATFYLYRHVNKPYHLDYCFASSALIQKLESVEVGTHEQWAPFSDHSPLIISFKD